MMSRSLELAGLDGTNPLGFLAALGTLASLHQRWLTSLRQSGAAEPRLCWTRADRWVPVLEGLDVEGEDELAVLVADSLRGRPVPQDAEARRAAAQDAMELASTAIKKKRDEIKKRRLRGSERTEAVERELRPLQREYEEQRRRWLKALREAVPRPELALGKRIDCTRQEYRDHAAALVATADRSNRESLDMLAAFGIDAVRQRNSDSIEPTPFCFITGSGHQFFLETARQLVTRVSAEGVRRALFRPWDYRDEGLSMRWDPVEDRRYALMDRDPTARGNEPRTMWMANLLAYRALALFPTAPTDRGLAATGWREEGDGQRTSRWFTWPLWEWPAGVDVVRSLLTVRELGDRRPDCGALRARGIAAVYRAERIEIGAAPNVKINFSPARALCSRWR